MSSGRPLAAGELLDVGDGQRVWYETHGAPDGRPVVVLHGGPGSGSSRALRRPFDPVRDRVVQLDQRGCGRSTPHASEPGYDASCNTTEHLLRDLETLRERVGVERWLVAGYSWGSTLALAYAERHPERVLGVLLAGVTLTRRREIDWLYRGVAPLFPREFARFRAGVPERERDGDLIEAYHRLLFSPEPAVRDEAARRFHDWEAATLSIDPRAQPPEAWSDARYRLARARIVTHYFRHAAWLADDALLAGARALRDVPGVLVHGRLDLAAPLAAAVELASVWPSAELVVVEGAGHSAADPGLGEAIVAAAERLARR